MPITPERVKELCEYYFPEAINTIVPAYFSVPSNGFDLMVAKGYIVYPNGKQTGYRVIAAISFWLPIYSSLSLREQEYLKTIPMFSNKIPEDFKIWIRG